MTRPALNSIKPVYFVLFLLGLNKNYYERRRCSKRFPTRLCFILAFLHLYFLHSFLYTSYNLLAGLEKNTLFINFAATVYSFSSICTLDYFLLKKRQIYEMIDEITTFPREQHPKLYLRSLKRETKICVCLIFLGMLFCVYRFVFIQFWISYNTKYFKPYAKVFVYGSKYLSNNATIFKAICTLEGIVFTLCTTVRTTIMLLTLVLCRILKIRIDLFIAIVKKASLTRLCHQHDEMFNLTRRLESHVDFFYKIWALQWVITSVVYVPKLVEMAVLTNHGALMVNYGVHAAFNLAMFIGVSLSLAAMHDAQSRIMSEVHVRISKTSLGQTSASQFLLIKMATGNLQIKVCKSVELTRYFILSFYSLILTYVVAAIQRLLKNVDEE